MIWKDKLVSSGFGCYPYIGPVAIDVLSLVLQSFRELVTLISLCICCHVTVSALWCCELVCNLIVSERRKYENTGRENNWATICDCQKCGILTSVDSDEPVQPPFKLRNSKLLYSHRLFKRLAKALIRLRVCAGWSEVILIAYTTLLEISGRGSFILCSLCIMPI